MADTPTRQGRTTEHQLQGQPYTASAQWQTLYDRDKPVAELFHVAYTMAEPDPARRPMTFVFNGGPGAASAYLHMGALGPRRVVFNPDGSLPRPPVQVADNVATADSNLSVVPVIMARDSSNAAASSFEIA